MSKIDINKYLERIGFKKEPSVNIETLRDLHKKHLYSISFENLDIHNNRNIILDIKLIGNKILNNKRGGFCYELNGLFYELLKKIGYNVKIVSARVTQGDNTFGPEFDHLVIIVDLGKLWLVDVGYGDNFIEPLEIKAGIEQDDLAGTFKIEQYEGEYFKLMRSQDQEPFRDEYIFTLEERNFSDFESMCKYHQTSPKSNFTKDKLCSIANPSGRITLSGTELIITKDGERIERHLKDELEFREELNKYFGITLK